MTKPMTWGPERSGYYEVVRGANLAQEDAFKSKANPANDSGVEEFNEGDFAVLDANGECIPSTADFELSAYPVVIGSERSDVRGAKSYTLALGAGFWIETSGWSTEGGLDIDDYPAGTEVVVRKGKLYPAAAGDFVLGLVKRGGLSQQTYAQKALQKDAFTTILVEWGPRGYKAA